MRQNYCVGDVRCLGHTSWLPAKGMPTLVLLQHACLRAPPSDAHVAAYQTASLFGLPLLLWQRDLATAAKIQANVPNLRRYGVNSDYVVVSRAGRAQWRVVAS